MRDIKFRAWVNSYSHWHMTDKINISNTGVFFHVGQSNITNPDWKLMQYTGLKDKNGKEIYEGDIVKQEYSVEYNAYYDPVSYEFVDSEHDEGHHIGEIVIIASKGACMRKPLCYSVMEDKATISNQYKSVAGYRAEVIGNIYDNPELLEVSR